MTQYSQKITRQNPALFLFLLDQSYSMVEQLGNDSQQKQDQLATAINSLLQNMVIQATKDEGVRHYMDVAVIGYRTDDEANPIIESPLSGVLQQQDRVSIVEIGENMDLETRMQEYFDDDIGEMQQAPVEFPVWVKPKAQGGTPMCTALHKAYQVVDEWIEADHKDSFPPIVVHITDGECSEAGDPVDYADPLKSLETTDGNVLLFNCHLSMTKADPFMFPSSRELLPDDYARLLFDMSSEFPESMYATAVSEGFELQAGARGMVFNADMVSLIKFLNIGTGIALELR
jgi:hypothetical protein